MTILIADDDRALAHLLATRLKAGGFRVVVVYDVMQAVMAAIRTPPDAIILDIGMPGGTGLDVIHRIRSSTRTSSIPVVVITASSDAELEAKVRQLGADEFFRKPVDFDRLDGALNTLLGRGPGAGEAGG